MGNNSEVALGEIHELRWRRGAICADEKAD
jgi:hypothetical protein